jgi:hypothetical protein
MPIGITVGPYEQVANGRYSSADTLLAALVEQAQAGKI